MERKPVFISVCNQKGGIGKSTFTVLLADILHYMEGYRVLVADCDYPQKSIFDQRKRELALLDRSPRYKSLLVRQFGVTHREIWPVIASTPDAICHRPDIRADEGGPLRDGKHARVRQIGR